MRESRDAGTAPDGPEIEQHDFAFEIGVGERTSVYPILDLGLRRRP
jgi:hypothetical protein